MNNYARDENGWPLTRLVNHPERHYQVQTIHGDAVQLWAGVTSVTKDTENVEILKTWFLNKGLDLLWSSPLDVPEGTVEREEDPETGEATDVPLTKAKLFKRARKAGQQALNQAGNFGNIVHNTIQAHLTSDNWMDPIDLETAIRPNEPRREEALTALWLWNHWWSKMRVKRLIAVERPICSERYGYAGTPDLVFEDDDGRVVLCDWKTSKRIYGSYLLQAGAYAEAALEFGLVIDIVQIVRTDVAKGRLDIVTATHPDIASYGHMFLHALAHWRNLQTTPLKLKQGTTYVKPK